MELRETGTMMVKLQKSTFVVDGVEILGIVSFSTSEKFKIEINGEKLSVKSDRGNVIVNGEEVGVSESISGDAASAAV